MNRNRDVFSSDSEEEYGVRLNNNFNHEGDDGVEQAPLVSRQQQMYQHRVSIPCPPILYRGRLLRSADLNCMNEIGTSHEIPHLPVEYCYSPNHTSFPCIMLQVRQ